MKNGVTAEMTGSPTGFRTVVLLVGLVWAVLLAVEIWMRFSWYGWQVMLVTRQAGDVLGPDAPMQRREVPESAGGDLTGLMGRFPWTAQFEEKKPAFLAVTDESGFRNEPPTAGRSFPIVTVGDSYVAGGATMTNTLSAALARLSGEAVYNYGLAAHGPLVPMMRFMGDERFVRAPPKVLVWGLVEREIRGSAFGDMAYRLSRVGGGEERDSVVSHINWHGFRPEALKKSLLSTSIMAQFSSKAWTMLRYYAFGRISSQVAIARRPVAGGPMLFYTWSVRAMRWPPEVRRADLIVQGIKTLSDHCRARGITLVVLLIPDKERVYREYLPEYLDPPGDPLPDSALNAVEAGLHAEGIRVANLLGPYREQAGRDILLYWRDDTHWNARGVELAAVEAWAVMKDLF